MNQYPSGETITLTTTFYSGSPPAPTDPTAVTGELRLPDQSVISLTIVKDNTGIYHANYTPQPASGNVTGAVNNGGLIRLTLDDTSKLQTGMGITVAGILGTTEANGFWTVAVIDGAHVDLQGSKFTNAFSGAGTWSKTVPNGLHHWRFAGTGTVVAAYEGDFLVQSSFSS